MLLIALMLGGVFAVHSLILYPYGHVAVLYAVPTLLAARWFAPKVALGFAVLALAGHTLDSWLDGTPVISWTAEVAAIALVSLLGISVAEQSRRQGTLARDNAALAEYRRREAERMGVLAEASQLFSSSLHLETVLQTVVDRTAAATGDVCLLFLLDDTEPVLRLQTVGAHDPHLRRRTSEQFEGKTLPLGVGVAGAVAVSGREVLLPNVAAADLAEPSRFLVEHLGFDSYLAVPLSVRGEVIGVLSLGALTGSRPFDDGDLHLAIKLAALAAGGIANARLYAEQQRLVAGLSEARREREQFISMVTHEMGNACTVLGGYAQLLAVRDGQTSRPSERAVERMLSQTQRLSRLVDDLRDVSRIEQGAFTVEKQPCDLLATVREVISDSQATTTCHTLQLRACCEQLCGNWDNGRLAQALANLVKNAIKYSPEGGDVTVTIDREGDLARVTVEDEGVGMEASDLSRLFKPYTRLEQTASVKGTGLGLFITKAIVEAHGGRIEVASTPGKGSRFAFVLPGAHPVGCWRCQAWLAQPA
ncbi:MAG: sensor histidine kinase [Chloroflexota bacterium]